MTARRPDAMARLAGIDPARELLITEQDRTRAWHHISANMHVSSPLARPRGSGWRGWRRTSLIAVALCLLVAGVALGSGLVKIGSPAKPDHSFTTPRAGLGALKLGSVRLLPIATPDPHGGPPWGLRVFSTTRGVGCIQVGRLVDGRIGALGEGGVFANDGRFHAVPVRNLHNTRTCSALDANGLIFNNVSRGDYPANAWDWARVRCAPATASPAEKKGAGGRICPQADERDLFYGLLGPEAKSITYTSGTTHKTQATVGPEGAYLIVTDAPAGQQHNTSPFGTEDVVPVDGPITAIHYRDGATCHLTARSWIGGASACTPTLKVPVGYTPVGKPPTVAQVSTPIRVHLIRAQHGRYQAILSFKSRVAVNSDRAIYKVQWRQPNAPPWKTRGSTIEADVKAGQQITIRTGALPRGTTEGKTILQYAAGPALLEGPNTLYRLVNQFTVHVP
jgi:hypothetical protein